ncbi:hypothetical protein ATZ33_12230 [Enterococcus silesiacus]|uniref:Gram-positive cocci surface proteins LPxTG domain-containing protein n=1 Tax=Enterococcus silesiacus TaxID=332949 RepID=A0A0S3KCT2_9ENTE|nr:LPXTG cell wall anchor domain-containing protein [Enterococcus silesiacus]ALS02122.1 hypothetical protein ATZ33_12230 [Enterococcus silesiacus]OJG91508.1 hypothetical protein RV15_GL000594 [Enterococcus silesiacus]
MKNKLLIVIGMIILVSVGSPCFASEADSEIGILFTEKDSLPNEASIVEQPKKDRVENNRVLPKTGEDNRNMWSFIGSVVLYGIFLTRKNLKLKR